MALIWLEPDRDNTYRSTNRDRTGDFDRLELMEPLEKIDKDSVMMALSGRKEKKAPNAEAQLSDSDS
jgi:hypothetical protein